MIVELIGGPLDGETREIDDRRREYRILRPIVRGAVVGQTQISEVVPVEHGIYCARTHAPGFVPRFLYWWGWHS